MDIYKLKKIVRKKYELDKECNLNELKYKDLSNFVFNSLECEHCKLKWNYYCWEANWLYYNLFNIIYDLLKIPKKKLNEKFFGRKDSNMNLYWWSKNLRAKYALPFQTMLNAFIVMKNDDLLLLFNKTKEALKEQILKSFPDNQFLNLFIKKVEELQ